MTNIFDRAKAAPKTPPKGKATAKEKTKIAILGMEDYSAVCGVSKSLEAIKKAIEVGIKSDMMDEFIDAGMKRGARPDNFLGVDGIAQASCELRLRASNSPITTEEVELLKEHDIPVREDDVVEETYIINPEYAERADLLEKVAKALARVPGLPEDFILHQSHKKICADETSIDAIFKIKNRDTVALLLPLVTVPAVKPKLVGENAEKRAFEIVEGLISGDKKAEEAA